MTLKTPQEVADDFGNDTQLKGFVCERVSDVKNIVTQDRKQIATALLTALEGEKEQLHTSDGEYRHTRILVKNQTLDQAKAIVTKLLTPKV